MHRSPYFSDPDPVTHFFGFGRAKFDVRENIWINVI